MTQRVFQPTINAATQEMTVESLKAMMEHPKNNALIDGYRQAKRRMAEAEMRQALGEMVQEVVASDGYRKWLASELKKDERRTKKRVADGDEQRVRQYIAQMKSSLPAIILTVTGFDESLDRWNRKGRWRVQQYGHLSGLAVGDFDHVTNPEERISEWLAREDFNSLGIVMIFITPSGEGIKVVFKAREEWGNLMDNCYEMAQVLGVLDRCDSQCKNADHAHYIPKMNDVKYIDWEALFTYENPAYEARWGDAYRRGESDPTQPRWQELERQRKEARKGSGGTEEQGGEAPSGQPSAQTAVLSEREQAIVAALNGYYGESLAEGRRHETWLSETAPWLLLLTDNNVQKTLAMGRELLYVKNWNDQSPDELENCVATVQRKPLLTRRPRRLRDLLAKAGIDTDTMVGAADAEDSDLPTLEWTARIRGFFGVFPCMREVCEWSQERLWPFLVFATSGLAGTLMTLCWWFSYDNPFKRRRLNYNVLGIGDPAVGKGPLEDLCDLWTEPIAQADQLANDATNTWKQNALEKGPNRERGAKPHGVVRIHGARTSNNVFINDMMSAWAEVEGEQMHIHMLTVDSEALNSIKMAKGGSWIDRSVMEIKAWSNEKDSQQYANVDSMTGSFNVFWNQVRTCTPPALKVLANERTFGSGWPLRVSAIPVPDNDFAMIPLHTREEQSNETAQATIRQWAYRLDKRQGELPLWPLVEHAWHWTNDHMEMAAFNQDKAERMLLKRIAQTTICIAAPWVDMRHWQEREQTGTYQVDDTDLALLDLLLDIQYKTQRHYFYELARNYYDEQQKDATTFRRRTTRFEQCYQQLPEHFTTEQFAQVFGYANPRSAAKTIDRLLKDKTIERTKRGEYRKRVQNIG